MEHKTRSFPAGQELCFDTEQLHSQFENDLLDTFDNMKKHCYAILRSDKVILVTIGTDPAQAVEEAVDAGYLDFVFFGDSEELAAEYGFSSRVDKARGQIAIDIPAPVKRSIFIEGLRCVEIPMPRVKPYWPTSGFVAASGTEVPIG